MTKPLAAPQPGYKCRNCKTVGGHTDWCNAGLDEHAQVDCAIAEYMAATPSPVPLGEPVQLSELPDNNGRFSTTFYLAYCLEIRESELRTALATKAVPIGEGERWKDGPDEQGWWWHWDENPDHRPFVYSVLWSGTSDAYFIQYPDTRWCDVVGGKWKYVAPPDVPYTPPK